MSYKPEHKTKTRKRIIESAVYLFGIKGVEKASIDEIMARAGLTRGGFYKHFESKNDLLTHVFIDAAAQSRLSNPPNDIKNIEEWLDQLLDSYLSLQHATHQSFTCPLTFLARDASLANNPRINQAYEKLLKGHIEKIQDNFCKNLTSSKKQTVAISATALMIGALTMASAVDSAEAVENILMNAKKGVKGLFLINKN